jgi:hypothetical protein
MKAQVRHAVEQILGRNCKKSADVSTGEPQSRRRELV